MAAYFNLNNNEISKNLLVNKFNMILDNQGRAMLNEPWRSISWFVQKQPPEVFLKSSQISQENNLLESLFSKVAGLQPCNFIKKDSNTGVFL